MRLAIAAAGAITLATFSAAVAQPIELKYAYAGSPTSGAYTNAVVPWAENIKRDSDGTLEFKLYPGPALASAQNVYDRLLNGVFEACYGIVGFYQQQFPKLGVAMLPFEARTPHEAGLALWRLYEKGMFADELSAVKGLAFPVFTNMSVHAKKPVRTMADLAGVKVATMSRTMGEIVERLGGTPIALPHTDFYTGLQRGTVTGAGISWTGLHGLKLAEVTTHHVDLSIMGEGGFHFMNKQAYEKLPAKAKAAVDKNSGVPFSNLLAAALQKMDDEGRAYTTGLPGHTIIKLAPDEEARWRQTLAPITDAWVKATPNGAQVLAAYREEVGRIRAGQ
jgi:TRAP-type C4-dicarboxylate transport system substrate-binding protein